MKICYHAVLKPDGTVKKARIEKLEACCEAMGRAIAGEYVATTDLDSDGFAWSQAKICFICLHEYPEGSHREYMTISYCPWCREEIVPEEIGRSQLVPRKVVPEPVTIFDEVPVDYSPKKDGQE